MTVAAANGALRRARATLRERLPARSSEWSGSARSEEGAPAAGGGLTAPGEWRLLPTRANRQPTAARYLRAAGDTEFPAFGLPPTL